MTLSRGGGGIEEQAKMAAPVGRFFLNSRLSEGVSFLFPFIMFGGYVQKQQRFTLGQNLKPREGLGNTETTLFPPKYAKHDRIKKKRDIKGKQKYRASVFCTQSIYKI